MRVFSIVIETSAGDEDNPTNFNISFHPFFYSNFSLTCRFCVNLDP